MYGCTFFKSLNFSILIIFILFTYTQISFYKYYSVQKIIFLHKFIAESF